MSELKRLYKLDEDPATGEFADMVATLDDMSVEQKDELQDRHKFEHTVALASYGLPPEACDDHAAELIAKLQSVDPNDEAAVFQLELQVISIINQAKDKRQKAA